MGKKLPPNVLASETLAFTAERLMHLSREVPTRSHLWIVNQLRELAHELEVKAFEQLQRGMGGPGY